MKYPGFFLLFVLLLAACSAPVQQTPAVAVPVMDRFSPPAMPANPDQADQGAYVYYQVCMACHADKGQGLTDEWRAEWDEDANCWQSKCHGPNHPPQGFTFPQVTSPVIGEGTLIRFDNAAELHDYLASTMPWWNPGYLKADEYWQLTAYLLRTHNALPRNVTLNAGNASAFPLHKVAPVARAERPGVLFIASILAISACVIVVQNRWRTRSAPPHEH